MKPHYPWHHHRVRTKISADNLSMLEMSLHSFFDKGNPFPFFESVSFIADETSSYNIENRDFSWHRNKIPNFLMEDIYWSLTNHLKKDWLDAIEYAKQEKFHSLVSLCRQTVEKQRSLLFSMVEDLTLEGEVLDEIKKLSTDREEIKSYCIKNSYEGDKKMYPSGSMIHLSVIADRQDIIEEYLSMHYPILIRNIGGKTATDIAAEKGYWEILRILLCMDLSSLTLSPEQHITNNFVSCLSDINESDNQETKDITVDFIIQQSNRWKKLNKRLQYDLGIQNPLGTGNSFWYYNNEKITKTDLSGGLNKALIEKYENNIPGWINDIKEKLIENYDK